MAASDAEAVARKRHEIDQAQREVDGLEPLEDFDGR